MADFISRDELRKHLADCMTAEFCDSDMKKAVVGIDVYVSNMKAADVQPVDRWINVKDRLPEEMHDKSVQSGWSEEIRPSDSVLILTTGGSYDVAWYSYAYEDWTTDNEKHSYEKWEVAFWQPLPEPPKEGEQNV